MLILVNATHEELDSILEDLLTEDPYELPFEYEAYEAPHQAPVYLIQPNPIAFPRSI